MPNAWDRGSARVLAAEGFAAIGTTSAGIAFAAGLPDQQRIDRADMLAQDRLGLIGHTHRPDPQLVLYRRRRKRQVGRKGWQGKSHTPGRFLAYLGTD
jgi:hypothetical protein